MPGLGEESETEDEGGIPALDDDREENEPPVPAPSTPKIAGIMAAGSFAHS